MNQRNKKGSIIVSFMLLMFVAAVGTSLLTFCVLHTRIVKARSFKLAETEKMNQALVFYLHQFREKVFQERLQDFLQPEKDWFNSAHFPDSLIDDEHWVSHSFAYRQTLLDNYTKTRVIAGLTVTAADPKKNNYRIVSGVFIDILSGQIPLAVFPFFMNGDIGSPGVPGDVESVLKEKSIVIKSDRTPLAGVVPVDMGHGEFLLEALKIGGDTVGWRQIREKFGLPLSDSPIPEGFHILVEGNTVDSIFIQGDVERVVFSAGSQIQRIRFMQNTVPFELSYKPGENYFSCWDISIPADSLFKEKIIVNGSVWSLEQEEEGAFLPGTDLKLLVTGKTVISTSLDTIPDQLNLSESLFANLTLSCGKEQLEPLCRLDLDIPAVVVEGVDRNGPIELRAAIMVEGTFVNNSPNLKLSGSLYCEDVDNGGSMEIRYLPIAPGESNYYHTVDFKYISQFFIDYIEEV